MDKKPWEYFKLEYSPEPSGRYTTGYWYCYAEPGYDGCGYTPMDAMAECMIAMSKALLEASSNS
jgi:hypothetical protein